MAFIRYVALRPETVLSVVKTGRYPNDLPTYIVLDSESFSSKKTIADCLASATSAPDNTFIFMLLLPTEEDVIKFDPQCIRAVYLYSEKGKKLLQTLLKESCPAELYIRPDQFKNYNPPNSQPTTPVKPIEPSKRNIVVDMKQSPRLRARSPSLSPPDESLMAEASPVMLFSTPRKVIGRAPGAADIERITSVDQHMSLLQSAFQHAKRTILITSYAINDQTLEMGSLYKLIPQARKRGVKIYIYCNEEKPVDEDVLEFLEENVQLASGAYTHSKILAVDDDFVAVGSFNWLSATDHKHELAHDASLVFRDKADLLIQDLWKYLKFYRNKQFGNYKDLKFFEWNEDSRSSQSYDIENNSTLTYIPMLEQHQEFIADCLDTAQRRIVICSPFISANANFQEDFDLQTLCETVERGIEIFFVCKPDQIYNSKFDQYLLELNHPKIHLVSMDNIHLKTIVVDDHTIAEGSFNWLSASRDERSSFHNHEVTFVIQGSAAKSLIERGFDNSEVGQKVQSAIFAVEPAHKRNKFNN